MTFTDVLTAIVVIGLSYLVYVHVITPLWFRWLYGAPKKRGNGWRDFLD